MQLGSHGSVVQQLNGASLSLDQFSELAQEYLVPISETQQVLHQICKRFEEKGTILPTQCEEAIRKLNELSEGVQDFCEFLNETSYLPVVFIAFRYQLLYTLHLVEEQAGRLEILIDNFRVYCMVPTQRTRRKEIYDAFQTLFQQITDISQQTKFQDEAARFQNGRLVSILEEEPLFAHISTTRQNSYEPLVYILKKHESMTELLQE